MSARHPLFARFYGKWWAAGESPEAAGQREELLAAAYGKVIEVGAENGLNFAHYPLAVTDVLAIEPEPFLRRKATIAAVKLRTNICVVEGIADRLPVDSESFDMAVASLVLCSVPDQDVALAEMRRVLRPGGMLLFYEHVRSTSAATAGLQDRTAGIWSFFGGGCHPNRDAERSIMAAGFTIEHVRPFHFQPNPVYGLVAPHVIGRAKISCLHSSHSTY